MDSVLEKISAAVEASTKALDRFNKFLDKKVLPLCGLLVVLALILKGVSLLWK